jgi:hydrogenase maturation protein HypF
MSQRLISKRYSYYGKTQGVGFRPTVWKIANNLNIKGRVFNNHECAVVEIWATSKIHIKFKNILHRSLPVTAKIDKLVEEFIEEKDIPKDFLIINSKFQGDAVNILPDLAICSECEYEIFDSMNKRYGYPLTNCTQCGPRFSIMKSTPYDRSRTSMDCFKMCHECKKDYENPSDRRFHAQPIACRNCGPNTILEDLDKHKKVIHSGSIWSQLKEIKKLFKENKIIAIQGIGGFHLACDATNYELIEKLRLCKNRYEKPFAIMGKNIEMIKSYCKVNKSEEKWLNSIESPIVLLEKRKKSELPSNIAPEQIRLGFMLPYSPLHKLLFHQVDFPLLMTSANLSEEPQCISENEIKERMIGIADYVFWHKRKIINRMDDSVVQINRNKLITYRRARGFAPTPIKLPPGFGDGQCGIGLGAEIKNTFCLLNKGDLTLSPHLGDLKEGMVDLEYRAQIKKFIELYKAEPDWISIDLHPDYRSTIYGRLIAKEKNIKLIPIQHHHAHLAACMIENQLPKKHPQVFGITLDGMGYGTDGTLWGGEFFIADYSNYKRYGCFKPMPLLGGNLAMREPWRNTVSSLLSSFNWDYLKSNYKNLELIEFIQNKPIDIIKNMFNMSIYTSSCGRIFDAVAAAIGICRDRISYEGQAAMQLEAIIDKQIFSPYPISIEHVPENCHFRYLNLKPMWEELLNDLYVNVSPSAISAKFHQGLSTAITKMIINKYSEIKNDSNISKIVALSGGVFQNQYLKDLTENELIKCGFIVLTQNFLPSNDGSISLGQAVIASTKYK